MHKCDKSNHLLKRNGSCVFYIFQDALWRKHSPPGLAVNSAALSAIAVFWGVVRASERPLDTLNSTRTQTLAPERPGWPAAVNWWTHKWDKTACRIHLNKKLMLKMTTNLKVSRGTSNKYFASKGFDWQKVALNNLWNVCVCVCSPEHSGLGWQRCARPLSHTQMSQPTLTCWPGQYRTPDTSHTHSSGRTHCCSWFMTFPSGHQQPDKRK